MPIIIDTTKKSTAKSAYNAKFFSKELTGTGKTIGLINTACSPENLGDLSETASVPEKIREEVSGTEKTTSFPIDPLCCFSRIGKTVASLKQHYCELAEDTNAKIFMSFTPVSFTITERFPQANLPNQTTVTPVSVPSTPAKKLAISYRVDIIEQSKNPNSPFEIVYEIFSANPVLTASKIIESNAVTIKNTLYKIDAAHLKNFYDYVKDYDLYAELNEISKVWQTTIVDEIIAAYDGSPTKFPMQKMCRYVGLYKLSTAQYADFYQKLAVRFDHDTLKAFAHSNTYLLLQSTVENLKKTTFAPLTSPSAIAGYSSPDFAWCSSEQHAAITSDAPLNIVQAGAGTGKSTTIKARLEYLLSVGVDPKTILVLSFTNAAADNIKRKAPNVCSMTIAKMIDDTYTQNHPTHRLASAAGRRGEGSTFTNSLQAYAATDPLAEKLMKSSYAAESQNDYAGLLTLVEENYDGVIKLLDKIGQTTFQLEIILVYLEYTRLNIPFNIQHLIIDEVQDNAVFEFIFFLNLTCKLQNHLYLVGDCSQTLFEFRASDPKALSVIENSGIFKAFPLNTNYRSTQPVLDFANALLADIETNRNANIKLRSYKIKQYTQTQFKNAIQIKYSKLAKMSELDDAVEKVLKFDAMFWIREKLKKGEQIAVLTYSRRESRKLQGIIEKIYPDAKCISIIPEKNFVFGFFSKYVSTRQDKIATLPTSGAKTLCARVRVDIIANLAQCGVFQTQSQYPSVLARLETLLTKWRNENESVISDKIAELKKGLITRDELLKLVEDTLINFEIKENALRQSVSSQRNSAKKANTANANFVFSTIHSAKGLEFDNVIVLYKNQNSMSEEDKRMYYVALTRAKKSEFIMSYDTCVHPLIMSRYDAVVNHLPLVIVKNTQGDVVAITNKDGSVINADGTGYDQNGNVLNVDGSVTLASGIVVTPDENGFFDLTKAAHTAQITAQSTAQPTTKSTTQTKQIA